MKKANRDEGQNISALHPYLKCFFDKSLILYTYENPCELASSVDYPRSRIPQIFPSNKALKNFCRKKVKKRTVFLSKTVLLVVAEEGFEPTTSGLSLRAGLRSPDHTSLPLVFSDRCPMSASLLPPQAALGSHSQRATLAGLITRSTLLQFFHHRTKK